MEYEQFVAETEALSDQIIALINEHPESIRLAALTNVLSAGVVTIAEGNVDVECKTVGAIIMDLTMRVRQRMDAELKAKAEQEASDDV